MTLLVIHADTRSGHLDVPINTSDRATRKLVGVDEIKVLDETEDVVMHLFRVRSSGQGSPCNHCDLYEDEYMSICGMVPCLGSAWKDTKKAMEEL